MRTTLVPLDDQWDAFVDAHPASWFWQTSQWVRYQKVYRPGSVNESLGVVDDDGRLLGVAPLLTHEGKATFGGGPHPFPLATSKRAFDMLIDAAQLAIGNVAFAGHPFTSTARLITARYGPVSSGLRTHRVIDLTRLDWSKVRKSYHSLVNGAQRKYRFRVSSGDRALDDGLFAAYQTRHRGLMDRPRPDETYRWQAQWLADDRALVAVADDPAGVWGASYWYCYKGCAYYGSGAYAARDGVAHALVWEVLQALATRGYNKVDMGWHDDATMTDKDRALAFFKAGFGGSDVMVQTAVISR